MTDDIDRKIQSAEYRERLVGTAVDNHDYIPQVRMHSRDNIDNRSGIVIGRNQRTNMWL